MYISMHNNVTISGAERGIRWMLDSTGSAVLHNAERILLLMDSRCISLGHKIGFDSESIAGVTQQKAFKSHFVLRSHFIICVFIETR